MISYSVGGLQHNLPVCGIMYVIVLWHGIGQESSRARQWAATHIQQLFVDEWQDTDEKQACEECFMQNHKEH
eukprot:4776819-Amphidinium_carterae.1